MATPSSLVVKEMAVDGPRLLMGSETIGNADTTLTLDFSSYGETLIFFTYDFEGSSTAQPLKAATDITTTPSSAVLTFAAPTTTCTLKYVGAIR